MLYLLICLATLTLRQRCYWATAFSVLHDSLRTNHFNLVSRTNPSW